MSDSSRTKYDLLDATERNTRRASRNAAIAAGATVVNAYQTARLKRLQEESNELQRETNDLQRETQRLQEAAVSESRETRQRLTGLGYDFHRFSQAYAINENAARAQRNAELKELAAVKNSLQLGLSHIDDGAQQVVDKIEDSDRRNDWRKFKADWIQTDYGQTYLEWCGECRDTIARMRKYHDKMIEARRKDRERLIAQAMIDNDIPPEPVLSPKESFFSEWEPSMVYPSKPSVKPVVEDPLYCPPYPDVYRWKDYQKHYKRYFNLPDWGKHCISAFAILGCIITTFVLSRLWDFEVAPHKGIFAFVSNAADGLHRLFLFAACFLVSAVIWVIVWIIVFIVLEKIGLRVYNKIVTSIERKQKPSESDLEKIKRSKEAIREWEKRHEKYEADFAEYQRYLSKKNAAENEWRAKIEDIKRQHREWEERKRQAEESWEKYAENERWKLEDRRQRCVQAVEQRIPNDHLWSADNYLKWIDEVRRISSEAYHEYPTPNELPYPGMTRLQAVDFFPEECVHMRAAMADIRSQEQAWVRSNTAGSDTNGANTPMLLEASHADTRDAAAKTASSSGKAMPPSENYGDIYILTGNVKREQDRKVEARLRADGNGFTVLRGSTIALTETSSCPSSATVLRKDAKYVNDGIVIRDAVFESPSAAAGFVLGSSCNGWEKWKTRDGRLIKELRV